MSIYNPPNTFFNGINFNNDFYSIPNGPSGSNVSLSYANSHYLFSYSGANATSSATFTYFSGGVGIGTNVNGGNGYLTVLNLNCVNSITGNNIYAASNFYENNTLLSTKYQGNLLASKIDYIRYYPPTTLISSNYTVSAQPYGNGLYITSASSYLPLYSAFNAFNYPSISTTYFQIANSTYTGTSGAYAGTLFTAVYNPSVPSNFYGEWLQIQFPTGLTIKNYSITGFTSAATNKNPSTWFLVGSFDGVNWYFVDNRTGITSWNSSTASVFNYTPDVDGITPYQYYRMIITNSNGSTTVGIQNLIFYATDGTSASAAVSSAGIGIGTNSLTYPTSFSIATGNSYFANSVGIGTTASGTIGDLKSLSLTTNNITTNNINNSNVIWSPTYYINQSGTSVLSLTSFAGQYSTSSIIGDTVLTCAPSQSLILQSGVSGGAAIYINSANKVGISTSTLNSGSTLDVGGTSTSTLYTYLNGLRISGVDANTIYQSISGSNIALTTASTSSFISFNIGNGINIAQITNSGLYLGANKGIGLGTAAPASNQISITAATSTAGALINGTNARIGLNNDSIYLGYASANGSYSTSALTGDFIIRNTNGQVIIQSSNGNYPNMLINGSGTLIVNPTNGATCAYFDIAGNLTAYNTLNASNGITTGGSINVTGGTPSTFGPLTAAVGTISGTNVTVAPFGYLWWGGGNGSTVVSESVPSSTSYSIKCQYALIAAGLISNSDKRIKRDIINIDNSLEIIEKIEPKNYNLIETAQNKYGFIAQDVKKIAPSVVNMSHEYIPNIFDYANNKNKIITFDNKNNIRLKNGDQIKINYKDCKIINVINNNKFEIDIELEDEKVFIIGTMVHDFLNIDYNMITTINTAAIKELYKIIQKQQEQINNLLSFIK